MADMTLSQLAVIIAETADPDELKSVARQIQHWTTSDVFKWTGVALDAPNVGKGYARRYPYEAIPWCTLMLELARRGLSVVEILQVVNWIRLAQLAWKRDNAEDLFAKAIEGGPGPVLLKVIAMRFRGPDSPNIPLVKAELIDGELMIDENWGSGVLINLSRIMERVRPFFCSGENIHDS